MLYIDLGETILKATNKQWKDCIAEQLAWLWHRAPIDRSYRDLPVAKKRSGGVDLLRPDAWGDDDWVDESYTRGLFQDRDKRPMIEVCENVFVSAEGYHLSCSAVVRGVWTLKNQNGTIIGDRHQDLAMMLRKNKLEICWRFM